MPRKNASTRSSRKYHELKWRPGSPYWHFHRYSKEKMDEFRCSTGIPATEKEAAAAYKVGVEKFDQWLGTTLPGGRQLLMRDLLRAVLASKPEFDRNGEPSANFRSYKNQIENHLMPAFGHLRPDQVTSRRWEDHDKLERAKGRQALFNERKALIEAMGRAKEHGLIKEIPDFVKNDPDAEPPKYLSDKIMRKILRHPAMRFSKVLYFLLWKQGPRPTEALRYRWDMIRWDEGDHGYIHIPGSITKTRRPRSIPLNSRVSRVLKGYLLQQQKKCPGSPWIFPSRYKPGERQKNYRKGWEQACEKLRIEADPYNVRDTFINNCIKRRMSLVYIARYVDNSVTQIERRYAVAIQEEMTEVAG